MIFRHVDTRPLQRLVRRRRDGKARATANWGTAGRLNTDADAEPRTRCPHVLVREVSMIPVPIQRVMMRPTARVNGQHGSALWYDHAPLTITVFYQGRGRRTVKLSGAPRGRLRPPPRETSDCNHVF